MALPTTFFKKIVVRAVAIASTTGIQNMFWIPVVDAIATARTTIFLKNVVGKAML